MNKLSIIASILALFSFASCERALPNEVIPFALINEDINLKNIQYLNLSNPGGFVYHTAGYKGLIIYHEGGGAYRVFERACSYDPRSECTPVVMDESTLFFKHQCCNSTFSLNGNPTSGPASLILLEYYSIVDGNYLKIRNAN